MSESGEAATCCTHCGGPVDPDIFATVDEDGLLWRLTGASQRGHVALLLTLTDVVITVDAAALEQWIAEFNKQGLRCQRRASVERYSIECVDD